MGANQARLPRMTSEEMIKLSDDDHAAFSDISACAGYDDPSKFLSVLKKAIEIKNTHSKTPTPKTSAPSNVKTLSIVKDGIRSAGSVHGMREIVFGKIGAGEIGRNLFGDVRLDIISKRIFGKTDSVRLTEYEFVTFWLVLRGQGNFISSSEIAYFIYEELFEDIENDLPIANVVDVLMCRVRKKLSLVTNTIFIETRHGLGYSIESIAK